MPIMVTDENEDVVTVAIVSLNLALLPYLSYRIVGLGVGVGVDLEN